VIADRKKFFAGALLLAGFVGVLVLMFLPLYQGKNLLNHLDALFNCISKGSAYYMPELKPKAAELSGTRIAGTLKIKSEAATEDVALLLRDVGAQATVEGASIQMEGDLGRILTRCVEDADLLYANDGAALEARYDIGGRRTLFCWWHLLAALERELKAQKKFKEASTVSTTMMKGVECAYNYHGIEPQKIADRFWVVVLSLLFYVVYTVWYGFAIMYLFEGLGLKLSQKGH